MSSQRDENFSGARPKASRRQSAVEDSQEIIASGDTIQEMLENFRKLNPNIPDGAYISVEAHQTEGIDGDEQLQRRFNPTDESLLASYVIQPQGEMMEALTSSERRDEETKLSVQLQHKLDILAEEQIKPPLLNLCAVDKQAKRTEPIKPHLKQIDFKSGQTHRHILYQIAENFSDLADQNRVDWHARFQEDTTKIIRNCLRRMRDEFGRPVKYEYLESGSAAEQVTAVNTRYEGLKPGEWSEHVFPTEQDIMAVLNIEDLAPPGMSYRLESAPLKPTHIKILMFPGRAPAGSLHDSLFDSPDVDFVQGVDSRGIFNLTGYDYYYNFSDLFQQAYQEYLRGDFRYHQLSCQIVKIESLPMAVSWKLTFKQLIKYSQQYRAYNPAEGVHTDEAVMDLVPSIRLPEWPESATEWLTRKRKWPSEAMVEEIRSKGILMICKMRQKGLFDVMEWRLSFSEVEVKLISDRQAPCKQHAHKIFKYIIKHMASPPRVLSSYHCKMVLLWACERLPPEYWSWENLGRCVLGKSCQSKIENK